MGKPKLVAIATIEAAGEIAKVIRGMDSAHNGGNGFIDVRPDIANEFARHLAAAIVDFDRRRFIAACTGSAAKATRAK